MTEKVTFNALDMTSSEQNKMFGAQPSVFHVERGPKKDRSKVKAARKQSRKDRRK